MPDARLDHLDKEEMWDVCRRLLRNPSREQFEADWAEFLALKARRELH
jgi:hypothetical protein